MSYTCPHCGAHRGCLSGIGRPLSRAGTGEVGIASRRLRRRLYKFKTVALKMRKALGYLGEAAHREVSPTYSAHLDDAFTVAEIAEGDYDKAYLDDEKLIEAGLDPEQANGRGLRMVVCAACKMEDGTLVLGARHWDGRMIAQSALLNKERSHDPADQGFIDQKGVYMDRTEAWQVAQAAGQIIYRCGGDSSNSGTLYSENLY